ncbi:hypothetical protein FE257_012624 [Aspergillus nanangensis]|uniref:Uncharacterized protein n=1 Tax=Aspergillus nanangensis TaxID=2582783 RepID=A0AAD4CFZ5_ASPNN|nr:hypothetical protein FE257_012624 [Aspergillus nanangensis]
MSFGHGIPNPGEGMEEYYEGMQSQWPSVDASQYGGISHPYSSAAPFPSSAILTPMSLPPDSSYVHPRPSPVLSHHSQEYSYGVSESIPQHGLGITAPFPGDFPRTVTAGYGYHDAAISPPQPPPKRARRSPRPMIPGREGPVSILPHPEGLQRLEQERRQGHIDPHPHQRPRAPGRGRRDPQAEEEDAFVERLRDQNMAWKVIREMFRETFDKDATEARLQMRLLRRRKERLARWDENDIQLLIRARDYWELEKYNLIAQKMRELGARRTYTPQQCEAQLRFLDTRTRASLPRTSDSQRARRREMLKASHETPSVTAG